MEDEHVEADRVPSEALVKAPTGVRGLDDITRGGLPQGRPTLVCGSAGSGKTLLAMEFLVRGAVKYGEPGLFVAFEETAEELVQNVASLGWDLSRLTAARQLVIDSIYLERREIVETGEFDLEGLFIRLQHAIDSIGARRVVLDTLETLFAGLPNAAILRAELRRLFRWLKERGVTAIITGERGDGALTRYGIEEYVSDCVLLLDHRVTDQLSTRRMRVVKYRGSLHGTNEYPFLIDEQGIQVLPITSLGLDHVASDERISTGIAPLDEMLGGLGLYRGSSVLVSGTAGCGKTSLAAHFAAASCARQERCLYFLFEESASQLQRNMRSIGLDLAPWVQRDLLRFQAARSSLHGLEAHLANLLQAIRDFAPQVVVLDPMSSFTASGGGPEIKAMLVRLIDFLKSQGITAMLLNLTRGGAELEHTDAEISSLIDTWLLLRDIELNGERNRAMYILKSRGMAHSHQIREFVLTARGIELTEPYLGPAGVLTGSSRLAQEARDREEEQSTSREIERQGRILTQKRELLESQIAALRAEFATAEMEVTSVIDRKQRHLEQLAEMRAALCRSRHNDT